MDPLCTCMYSMSVILTGDRVHVCGARKGPSIAQIANHVFPDFAENRVNHRTSSSRFPGISRDRCGEARALRFRPARLNFNTLLGSVLINLAACMPSRVTRNPRPAFLSLIL